MFKKTLLSLILIIFCVSGIACMSRIRKSVYCKNTDNHAVRELKNISIGNALGKTNLVHSAIIGSGPAGWSAAIYGARFKRNVVVFKGPTPGGLLTKTSDVENWPGKKAIGGADLIHEMESHARSLGVLCVQDTIESVDFSSFPFVLRTEQGSTINALSVIIATGGTPVALGVKGEKQYSGKGVTSCAKCDAPFYKDEDVVIVGGGDSAIEEAIQLAPYARTITILVRKDRMRAAPIMQDRLLQYPSISVLYNVEVKEIVGDENQVTGVALWDNKKRTLKKMATSGLFLAIGHKPNTELFASALQLDQKGYIKLLDGRTQKTSVPGVFAAGDSEDDYYRQAIVAAGSGVRAAIDADAFLTEIGLNPTVEAQLRPYLFKDEQIKTYVKDVTTVKDFDVLLASGRLIIVDFFTANCPQCNEFEPIFSMVAREYAQSADFIKINAQELITVSERFYVYKVPCVMVFKDGNIVARYGTLLNKEELKAVVDKFIA